MTIPTPERFFEQAEALASKEGKGAPRQVNLRRSISAAIATARTAIKSFDEADADQQKTFLALLVCRRR